MTFFIADIQIAIPTLPTSSHRLQRTLLQIFLLETRTKNLMAEHELPLEFDLLFVQ